MTLCRSFITLALVVVVVLVSNSLAASLWDGQWSDENGYGGNQFFCSSDDAKTVWGAWSNSGVLVGSLSTDQRTLKGTWYEAGSGPCFSGPFEWTLDADNNGFSGYFACAAKPAAHYLISERRIDSNVPSNTQCARLSSKKVSGKYTLSQTSLGSIINPTTRSVCVSSGSYESSYTFDFTEYHGVGYGYEHGDAYESGAVISGYYENANGDSGVSIAFRTVDDVVIRYYWPTEYPLQHRPSNTNTIASGTFGVEQWTSTSSASAPDCNANDFIQYPFGDATRSTSISSMLIISIMCISFIIIMMLF